MNNYNTSRDYELLWELTKTQDVICIINTGFENVAIAKLTNGTMKIFSRTEPVYSYFKCFEIDKDLFIEQCKDYNLEFIVPNAWISVKDGLPEEKKLKSSIKKDK